MFVYLIVSVIFGIVVAMVAQSKGRSAIGFFFLSILITPLIAVIILLIMGPEEGKVTVKKLAGGLYKKCPYCAEVINREAIVCKHCHRDIIDTDKPGQPITNQHAALQDAIYKKDEEKVRSILSTGIVLSECDMAFTHKEYAEEFGTKEIKALVINHSRTA